MKDEKHIRVPIRHTFPHKSSALLLGSSLAHPVFHCTVQVNVHSAEEDEGGQRNRQAGRQTGVLSWSSSHLVPSALYGLPELLGSNDLHQSLSVTTVSGATQHPATVWLKPAPSQVSYYLAFVLILMQRLCYLPLGQGNESQCHFRDGLCRIAVI